MSSRPNDFPPSTREALGASVGYCCVRPGCQRVTTTWSSDGRRVNTGQAAHDAPAGQGARSQARDEEGYTDEQIKAFANGAWLCSQCAREVDADPELYPLHTLPQWQMQAMQYRENARQQPQPRADISLPHATAAAEAFCKAIQALWVGIGERQNQMRQSVQVAVHVSKDSLRALHWLVQQRWGVRRPHDPLNTQYPHTVNLQVRMIECAVEILNEIQSSGNWYNEFGEYYLTDQGLFFSVQEYTPQCAAICASGERVLRLYNEIFNARRTLLSFSQNQYSPGWNAGGW